MQPERRCHGARRPHQNIPERSVKSMLFYTYQERIRAELPEHQPRKLDVHLPYGCGNQTKDDVPVKTMLTFDIDDFSPEDFLSRVCATIGVDRESAKLGWKTCDDKKKDDYKTFGTPNVLRALEAHAPLPDSKLRKKRVFMEIVNLVCEGPISLSSWLILTVEKGPHNQRSRLKLRSSVLSIKVKTDGATFDVILSMKEST
jgi:hypothetical protein